MRMNIEYLILEKKVKEADDQIKHLAVLAFADRIIPNWMPPEYAKAVMTIKVPIDYLNDENIEKFQKELRRIVNIRWRLRQEQAKKKLDMDLTKIEEIVPS